MRQAILAQCLFFGVLMSQPAMAEDFWYTPPGYNLGDYYGVNLGNGVGYGVGVGIPLPLEALNVSKTVDPSQLYLPCCDEATSVSAPNVAPTMAPIVPVKPKSTAAVKVKKIATKTQSPKPVTKTKPLKLPLQTNAKTKQAT